MNTANDDNIPPALSSTVTVLLLTSTDIIFVGVGKYTAWVINIPGNSSDTFVTPVNVLLPGVAVAEKLRGPT